MMSSFRCGSYAHSPPEAGDAWPYSENHKRLQRSGLIAAYLKHAGGLGDASAENRSIDSVNDPLFAVWARKLDA